MPRSSRKQTESNRAKIVESAGRLFRRYGYETVGIADVMSAAGLTQGGFYKHFASKEALAVEAWAAGFLTAETLWRERATGTAPLASVVDFYLSDMPPEHRCPLIAHGEEAARLDGDSALRRVYLEGARSLHDIFSRLEDAEGADDQSKLLFAAMLGVNLLRRIGDGEEWVQLLASAVRCEAKRLAEPRSD